MSGAALVPEARAVAFDLDLQPLGEVPFPNLKYRVTDASTVGADGRLWVSNYHYPPEQALRLSEDGFELTDRPPVPLQLSLEQDARNWEALAAFADGVLLMNDNKVPQLVYAELPKLEGSVEVQNLPASETAPPPEPLGAAATMSWL